MIRILAAALALFLIAAPGAAQTADEQARLDWALERGRTLFAIDRAAWVTTDDLRERAGDLARSGVRGWVVERDGAGYVVSYFTGEGDARAILYRARVEDNRIVSAELLREGARPSLTPLQRRLADARGAVARIKANRCSEPGFNLAAIPPERDDGPMDVYLLTPQTQAGIFPFGGHIRVTLSATGEILSQRSFTNTCFALPAQAPGSPPPGATMMGPGVTHLLDPIPTEIHVFMSIWIGLPVFVATNTPERVWRVQGDRIELIDPRRAPRL